MEPSRKREFINKPKIASSTTKGRQSRKRDILFFEKEYKQYLKIMNYSQSSIQVSVDGANRFLKVVEYESDTIFKELMDLSILNYSHLKRYENILINKCNSGKIKQSTAYGYLKSVRLLINFLYYKRITSFKYQIPKHLIIQPTRLNDYLDSDEINDFITLLLKSKDISLNMKIITLSILLILVNTGCRPNEIANIKMADINFTEKTLILYSKKSGLRKIKLKPTVIDILRFYLKVLRKNDLPLDSQLFLTVTGKPMTSSYISYLFSYFNKRFFNQQKISPRVLRHTFATNALENGNDFNQVSRTMGHKHWISTQYYLQKSVKRLLDNSLPHNPFNFMEVSINAKKNYK
jgi:integrase/recombinase XerC